jgi:hypothetical protein
MFCISFRGKEVTGHLLLREMDVFDEYAKGALQRTTEHIGIRRESPVPNQPIRNGESLPERAIRGLVLELALGMVERGRMFLNDEEILEIARTHAPESLSLKMSHIEHVNDLYSKESVLQAILEEGIVLESSQGNKQAHGPSSGIRFVYERYFEYSIGRALVRRWVQKQWDREQIIDEFKKRMEQHEQLLAQGFNNLQRGLGIAVTLAEDLESLPQGIYRTLLVVLAEDLGHVPMPYLRSNKHVYKVYVHATRLLS